MKRISLIAELFQILYQATCNNCLYFFKPEEG